MTARPELLVFGCREDDLAVLRSALGATGPVLLAIDSTTELARCAIQLRPAAVFLGVSAGTLAHLDLIPVLRAVRRDLPVVIIGDEDSLEIERSARQRSIFYYLVHPLERSEVEAVLKSVLRCAPG